MLRKGSKLKAVKSLKFSVWKLFICSTKPAENQNKQVMTHEENLNSVTNSTASVFLYVVCLCHVPLDRMKGPTLTSGATTVTLSTAMALRFRDLIKEELNTNTHKKKTPFFFNATEWNRIIGVPWVLVTDFLIKISTVDQL